MNYMYSVQRYGVVDLRPPFRFGYNENLQLGDKYDQNTYMITTKKDMDIHSSLKSELTKVSWNQKDFELLENDSTI